MTTIARHRKSPTGTILKTHGVKGEVVIATDQPEEFVAGGMFIVEIEGLDVPFFINSVRPRGAESLLVTIDDIADEHDAAEFVGLTTYAYDQSDNAHGAADTDDRITADQLVGYTLFDEATPVGTITGLREITTDNWLFEVGDGILVPIADELIIDIDSDARTITMNLPSGILDL